MRIVREQQAAKNYFQTHFRTDSDRPSLDEAEIQSHLLETARHSVNVEGAELCLRCYLSHQIERVCIHLETLFGEEHGFTRLDLFPFVLNDVGQDGQLTASTDAKNLYPCLSLTILKTFDPNRANLSTWTMRLVKHDRDLKAFLLERGVYMVSDWAILNDTTPQQLNRILGEFHGRTEGEIRQERALLTAYHAIYRRDRMLQRQKGIGGSCPPPSSTQLQQIAERFAVAGSGTVLPIEETLGQLQALSQSLRQYRLAARGAGVPAESLDRPEVLVAVEQQAWQGTLEGEESEWEVFLRDYRQQICESLDAAIAASTDHRLHVLQSNPKTTASVPQFLAALYAFHCEGTSMGDIAQTLSLKAQYQVSRLLKLKELRADIQRAMAITLKTWLQESGERYATASRLEAAAETINAALESQLDDLFAEAAAEASIPKQRPTRSLFARRLCHYLHSRIPS